MTESEGDHMGYTNTPYKATDTVNVDTLVETVRDEVAHLEGCHCRVCAALSDLDARARHMEQWPTGSTEVQFCLHERRCLELREAEADRDRLRERLAREQRAADVESDELTRQAHEARADRDRVRVVLNKQNALLHDTARRVAELERERDEARRQVDQRETWFAQSRERVAELEAANEDLGRYRRLVADGLLCFPDTDWAARARAGDGGGARGDCAVCHGSRCFGSDDPPSLRCKTGDGGGA